MANTPTREHREAAAKAVAPNWKREDVLEEPTLGMLVRVAQAIADAEQRGFERGRERERAEVRAFLGNCGAAFRDVSAQFAVCSAIESGRYLAKDGE